MNRLAALPGLALTLQLATAAPFEVDTHRIDAAFAAYVTQGSPGCAVGVLLEGGIVYAKGYGLASLEHGVPITPETVFDLGSTSKQITAAAIGLLALDGRLSLDDDVRKTLPEVPDYGTVITIRHLLTHISGLRDYTDLLFLIGKREEDVTTKADAFVILARQRSLNFRPGAEYRYSNTGFFLASVIVERISGKTLREFARERIFQPLGMTRTQFLDDHTQVVPGRATGYAPRDGGGFKVAMSNWEQAGDGSVQSSVADLARWAENFDTGKVGGRKLTDLLESPGRLLDGTPLHYGLGLALDEHRGQRLISHGGSWAGYRAMLMCFPAQRLAVATLCNIGTADTTTLSLAAADAALDALGVPGGAPAPGQAPATPAAGARGRDWMTHLAGVYVNEHLGEVVRITTAEGRLRLSGLGTSSDLFPEGGGRFKTLDGNPQFGTADDRIRVRFEREGSRMMLTSRRLGPRPEAFVRADEASAPARQASAEDLIGGYGSPDLGATLTVAIKDGAPVLRLPTGDESNLVRISPDLYETEFGLVRFARDQQARVTSLVLTNRGLAGLVLSRDARPEGPRSGGV